MPPKRSSKAAAAKKAKEAKAAKAAEQAVAELPEVEQEKTPEPIVVESTDPQEEDQKQDNLEENVPEDSSSSTSQLPEREPEIETSEEKEEVAEAESSETPTTSSTAKTQWQAVWAPQYNAYYFFNSVTQETTWTNPLQPEEVTTSVAPTSTPVASGSHVTQEDEESGPSGGSEPSVAMSQYAALQAAAVAQGIDPLLAHLDPSLKASIQGTSGTPGDVPTFTAQFNAHTGKFAPSSSRTPGHLSEFERAKRMSEFYFDVNKWEEDLAKDSEEAADGELGKKRKRPTKKDIERFKEQKKQKKIAKTAWLRT